MCFYWRTLEAARMCCPLGFSFQYPPVISWIIEKSLWRRQKGPWSMSSQRCFRCSSPLSELPHLWLSVGPWFDFGPWGCYAARIKGRRDIFYLIIFFTQCRFLLALIYADWQVNVSFFLYWRRLNTRDVLYI